MTRRPLMQPLAADLVVELNAYDTHRSRAHRGEDCPDLHAHTRAVHELIASHNGDYISEPDRVGLPDGSIACWHLGRFGKGTWTSEATGSRCLFFGSVR